MNELLEGLKQIFKKQYGEPDIKMIISENEYNMMIEKGWLSNKEYIPMTKEKSKELAITACKYL